MADQGPIPEGAIINGYRIGRPLFPPTLNSWLYGATSDTTPGKFVFKYIRPEVPRHLIESEYNMNRLLINCPCAVVGFDFVAMEETLGFFMHQYTRGDLLDFVIENTLSKEAIARMARQVLRALHYFHSNGFAHRDVKPDNILLTGNDAIPDAHLGDLGYAAERTEAEGGMFLDQVGSKPYMAPELLLNRPYTEAVDMWAFGVLLFIMFTRKMPFPDPEQDRDEWMYRVVTGEWYEDFLTGSEAPPAAYALIAGCLSVDPEDRPTTAQALESEFFSRFGAGEDVKAEIRTLDSPFNDPFVN